MKTVISELSEHLPLSTRRVVVWVGERCKYETGIGLIEGLADGKILVRDFEKGTHYELTVEEAEATSKALLHAAFGVKEAQKKASGFYRITAHRKEDVVYVTSHGHTMPMRLSKLRGSRRRDHFGRQWSKGRRCDACGEEKTSLYVAVEDPNRRKFVYREHHVEVCLECVEKALLETARATLAPVREIGGAP